ncbi:hypothetical protein BG261_07910 [Floricoccus tropicus]|uniref:DUF2089 domain-containing protein n=1 Tax=Floricoccus tropicus TaxID=1859473 RepID=A0A1E8GKZ0_9LACT|nr:hypothetical protein BG261_07910 [Floricoccus tropicus]
MDWFYELDEEDRNFIKQFVLSSGSLRELAKIYGISYPTVRLRLDRLIEKIKLRDKDAKNQFEVKMMQMVIDEKIDLETAKNIISLHREDKKND